VSFRDRFPLLLSLSTQKVECVGTIRRAAEGSARWGLRWRRELFVWELELLDQLTAVIGAVELSEVEDLWVWRPGEEGWFTVRSAYKIVEAILQVGNRWGVEEEKVFGLISRSRAPSKVVALTWKALWDRIPTKQNLARRKIIDLTASKDCLWCEVVEETSIHLFIHCRMACSVWTKILGWCGINFITPHNLFSHLQCCFAELRGKIFRKGFWLIWHATIWVLCRVRNDKFFNNVLKEVDDVVEEIKFLSWNWYLHRLNSFPCLFYEWCWDPGECFKR